METENQKLYNKIYDFIEGNEYEELVEFTIENIEGQVYSPEEFLESLAESVSHLNDSEFRDNLITVFGIWAQQVPTLLTVDLPQNAIFMTILETGAVDLFDIFLKQVSTLFDQISEEQKETLLMDMYQLAETYAEEELKNAKPIYKFRDYGDAVKITSNDPMRAHVELDDYLKMEETIQKYNGVIGRNTIIEKLLEVYQNI